MAGIIAGAAVGGIAVAGVVGFLGAIAGFLAVLYFLIQPGTTVANRYGPTSSSRPGTAGRGYSDPGQSYPPPLPPDAYGASTPNPVATTPSGGGRYCRQCGAERAADARFCIACGSQL